MTDTTLNTVLLKEIDSLFNRPILNDQLELTGVYLAIDIGENKQRVHYCPNNDHCLEWDEEIRHVTIFNEHEKNDLVKCVADLYRRIGYAKTFRHDLRFANIPVTSDTKTVIKILRLFKDKGDESFGLEVNLTKREDINKDAK